VVGVVEEQIQALECIVIFLETHATRDSDLILTVTEVTVTEVIYTHTI
jgi:hypothetical protein